MEKAAIALILAASLLAGCNKKTESAKSGDAVDQKLQELAGSGASNCGRVKSVDPATVKPASDCAIQAAQSKKPFYVAYDLPGLTVAIAGASDGKLYSVQSQTAATAEGKAESKPPAPAEVTVTACPAELRLASSGRVTCYSANSFGAMSGANPHGGGMTMPPSGVENPHGGGMMMPPAGTSNPHGGMGTMPSSHGPATKNANPADKPASKQ